MWIERPPLPSTSQPYTPLTPVPTKPASPLCLDDPSQNHADGKMSLSARKSTARVEISERVPVLDISRAVAGLESGTKASSSRSGHLAVSCPASSSSPLPHAWPTPAGHRHQSPFLDLLPADLHYIVAMYYLDFDSLVALRQTCRTMQELLTPDLVRRVRAGFIETSLRHEAQQYRDYRSMHSQRRLTHLWDLLYAAFNFCSIERFSRELRCYGCLEVKPMWCFVERMSNRGTGLGAKLARDRMCKDCMRRYRDIQGQWWKENWVKKSETVRKLSTGQRIRQWALEGQSLVNPKEEIGVCSACGSGTYELWWGCVACFQLEEARRREEDLTEFDGLERRIVDAFDAWRAWREMKWRRRASQTRRSRKWWLPGLRINWEGSLSERKAALVAWKGSKVGHVSGSGVTSAWRAIDQHPLPKTRRETRCSSCWIPSCPRRTFILGLPYERPLPRDRWCSGCQQDDDERRARRGAQRLQTTSDDGAGGVFSDDWMDGLGCLFDEEWGCTVSATDA